jgi:putative ABC transport system ATP-binding protein
MSERAIAVRDVTRSFDEGRQRVDVLRGISMEVAVGELVALEGPSGSGKTTLLSIIGCILTPSSGELEVAGRRVERSDEAALREVRRRSIGFVFQQYNLFPALTALENVEYSLNVRGARQPGPPQAAPGRAHPRRQRPRPGAARLRDRRRTRGDGESERRAHRGARREEPHRRPDS